MDELTEYAKRHEDYSHDHSIVNELRGNIRLWGYEYERDPEDRILIDQDVLERVRAASKAIEKMTGYKPITIPRLECAMSDKAFLKSISEEGCAFVAFDSPEGSLVMVQAYRIFFKAGAEKGIQRHYQKNNKQRLEKGRNKRQANKVEFVSGLTKRILDLEDQGVKTYQAMADRLNQEATPTPSGKGIWHINTVQRVKKSIAEMADHRRSQKA